MPLRKQKRRTPISSAVRRLPWQPSHSPPPGSCQHITEKNQCVERILTQRCGEEVFLPNNIYFALLLYIEHCFTKIELYTLCMYVCICTVYLFVCVHIYIWIAILAALNFKDSSCLSVGCACNNK